MHGKNDHIFVPIHSTDTNVAAGKKSFRRVSMICNNMICYVITG